MSNIAKHTGVPPVPPTADELPLETQQQGAVAAVIVCHARWAENRVRHAESTGQIIWSVHSLACDLKRIGQDYKIKEPDLKKIVADVSANTLAERLVDLHAVDPSFAKRLFEQTHPRGARIAGLFSADAAPSLNEITACLKQARAEGFPPTLVNKVGIIAALIVRQPTSSDAVLGNLDRLLKGGLCREVRIMPPSGSCDLPNLSMSGPAVELIEHAPSGGVSASSPNFPPSPIPALIVEEDESNSTTSGGGADKDATDFLTAPTYETATESNPSAKQDHNAGRTAQARLFQEKARELLLSVPWSFAERILSIENYVHDEFLSGRINGDDSWLGYFAMPKGVSCSFTSNDGSAFQEIAEMSNSLEFKRDVLAFLGRATAIGLDYMNPVESSRVGATMRGFLLNIEQYYRQTHGENVELNRKLAHVFGYSVVMVNGEQGLTPLPRADIFYLRPHGHALINTSAYFPLCVAVARRAIGMLDALSGLSLLNTVTSKQSQDESTEYDSAGMPEKVVNSLEKLFAPKLAYEQRLTELAVMRDQLAQTIGGDPFVMDAFDDRVERERASLSESLPSDAAMEERSRRVELAKDIFEGSRSVYRDTTSESYRIDVESDPVFGRAWPRLRGRFLARQVSEDEYKRSLFPQSDWISIPLVEEIAAPSDDTPSTALVSAVESGGTSMASLNALKALPEIPALPDLAPTSTFISSNHGTSQSRQHRPIEECSIFYARGSSREDIVAECAKLEEELRKVSIFIQRPDLLTVQEARDLRASVSTLRTQVIENDDARPLLDLLAQAHIDRELYIENKTFIDYCRRRYQGADQDEEILSRPDSKERLMRILIQGYERLNRLSIPSIVGILGNMENPQEELVATLAAKRFIAETVGGRIMESGSVIVGDAIRQHVTHFRTLPKTEQYRFRRDDKSLGQGSGYGIVGWLVTFAEEYEQSGCLTQRQQKVGLELLSQYHAVIFNLIAERLQRDGFDEIGPTSVEFEQKIP